MSFRPISFVASEGQFTVRFHSGMSLMRSSSSTPAALILASGMLWASAGAAAQIVPGIASATLADARLVVGAIVLTVVIGPARLWRELKALPLPILVWTSLAMGLFQWSFFAAAVTVGGGVATLLSTGASPLYADMIEARGKHLPLCLRWWLEAAGYLFGLALLVKGFNLPIEGALAALLAGVAYAVFAATAAQMERQSDSTGAGIAITTLALAGGGIALLPAASAQFESLMSPSGLMVTAYLGVLVTALAYRMFIAGLRTVKVGTALALQVLQPLAAIVIDALLPGSPYSFASNRLVLVGTAIIIGLMFIRTLTQPLTNRRPLCPNPPVVR
jgi:drug/metabolite transporter, DME family